jgi:hypothetical protein
MRLLALTCSTLLLAAIRSHSVLFPDFVGSAGSQTQLFSTENQAGNAIKMAYLCYANTKQILPGDIVLFYRSADEQAITTFGIVESCETLTDSESIVARVKRRRYVA